MIKIIKLKKNIKFEYTHFERNKKSLQNFKITKKHITNLILKNEDNHLLDVNHTHLHIF
jgi:hypothetical protein